MYKIETTSVFEKDFKKLDRSIAKRIIDRLGLLAKKPNLAESAKYLPKDLQGLHKYRVGDWRVLLWIDHQRKIITLYGVEHRRSVYKRLGR